MRDGDVQLRTGGSDHARDNPSQLQGATSMKLLECLILALDVFKTIFVLRTSIKHACSNNWMTSYHYWGVFQ